MTDKNKKIIKGVIITLIIGISFPLIRMGFLAKSYAYFQDKDFNYSDSKLGFSIIFPNQPEVKSERVTRNGLTIDLTTIKSVGADKSEYIVAFTNYPEGTIDSSIVYEQLHNGRDAAVKNSDFEIIKSVDTLINNYPAVYAVTKSLEKKKHKRYMLMIIKENHQGISIIGDLYYDPVQRKHFEHYFNSLKILQPTAEEYFKQGCYKDSIKDYQGAINDLTKAIKLNHKYAEAYKKRGNAKYHLQDYQEAIADYTRAIEQNPKDEFYRNRGRVKMDLQDYEGAIADYTKAIEVNPKYTIAYINRGNAKSDLKDYQGAITDFNKAIELDPKDMVPYYDRGMTKEDLHDYQGAIADYTKAIELNPKYAEVYYERGNAKYYLKDKNGACLDWNKANELGDSTSIILIQKNCK
jgi:tetratricopeptide (TPR) repeat protein